MAVEKGAAPVPKLSRAPTRAYRSLTMDSRRWGGFVPRLGDIVIGTYPKCGTTWMQRIVDLLIFQTPDPRPVTETGPWLDATFFRPIEEDVARLAGQTHRRFIKTHMPFDAVPVWDGVSYLHVARDGRDSLMSFHNHRLHQRGDFAALVRTETERDPAFAAAWAKRARPGPRAAEPSKNARAFYLDWIEAAEAWAKDEWGADLPFFEFETTYWREGLRPNLLLIHYNDLTADLAGEMARIAQFLKIDVPAEVMPILVKAASFEAMKRDAAAILPYAEATWDGGAGRFIYKGVNGRWREVLTDADGARYEALAARKWSPAQAAWIAEGRLAAGDPRSLAD